MFSARSQPGQPRCRQQQRRHRQQRGGQGNHPAPAEVARDQPGRIGPTIAGSTQAPAKAAKMRGCAAGSIAGRRPHASATDISRCRRLAARGRAPAVPCPARWPAPDRARKAPAPMVGVVRRGRRGRTSTVNHAGDAGTAMPKAAAQAGATERRSHARHHGMTASCLKARSRSAPASRSTRRRMARSARWAGGGLRHRGWSARVEARRG